MNKLMKKQTKRQALARKRGTFAQLHGSREEDVREAMKPHNIKVGVYIKLDLDTLEFFKARAKQPGAAPYQTQINFELRQLMERERGVARSQLGDLTRNEEFLEAIAHRIQEKMNRK